MCHSVTWYYARCLHPDPHSTSLIACADAFHKGYECTEEHHAQISLARTGRCPDCKTDVFLQHRSITRPWWDNSSAAMDGVFHHHEDRSINDSDYESDDEASDMEPSVPQSPSIDGKAPTDLAENRLFHKGLARKSSLVQPASSPCSCNALVEDADNEEYSDDEYAYEPLTQESEASERRSYRSWLPLPTRLLEYEQIPSYVQLVSDDEMSDTEPLLETSEPKKHTVSRSWIPIPAKKVIGR